MAGPQDILQKAVQDWHNAQPHPQARDITVGDFPIAARMATMLKFGQGHASPAETANFWKEFQTHNSHLLQRNQQPYSPEDFIQQVQQMAKSSFAFHGRPPNMTEIFRLKDAHPQDVHKYFGSLPDEQHPHIAAQDMVKALESARPWANLHLGREPNKVEASYLHHSGQNAQQYYEQMKAQKTNGSQNPS